MSYLKDNAVCTYEKPLKLLKIALDMIEGDIILDVGCNAGYFTKMIAEKYPNATIRGIDCDKEAIALASRMFWMPNITYEVLPVEKLKDNKAYDCILFLETIEHINNAGLIIDKFKSLLNDNGVLIISTPNAASFENIKRNMRSISKTVAKINAEPQFSGHQTDHICNYDFPTLYRLLRKKGFEYEDFKYVGGKFSNNMVLKVRLK
jgi:2-polyprenyl-3-methyl-5-hydroxy-6-metoxy-1,4-benzoquinol methylase